MQTLHKRCAGLDVHKREVVACLRRVIRGKVSYGVRRFPTTTRGLIGLAEWLEAAECTHVAMEATGVYWKPVWHILEGRFQLILANAAHIKGVPGRKSDVNDATWIADLLAHGLIRSSFVPPQPIQELRDLTRTRKQLTREIVQHTQRIQAVLEEANIKLSSAITDILGASGRRILQALIAGETDPDKLSALGSPRLAASRSELSLKARCGPKKAAVAVAASILTTAYHMLADGTCYQDLGPDHFARRDPARVAQVLGSTHGTPAGPQIVLAREAVCRRLFFFSAISIS